MLWDVYGDCPNYAMLSGHTGAVLQIRWSRDGTLLFSASTDRTGGVWDTFTGQRVKKLRGHETFVNAIAPSMRGAQVVATGGDDGVVRLFDLRSKNPVMQFTHKYQITALTMSEAGDQIFAGSLDGTVQVWTKRAGLLCL